jgi:prophage regulatory protein
MDAKATILQPGALLRIKQIIGDKSHGLQPLIPVSRSHWWAGVKDGRFPKGFMLSERVHVWRSEDIAALLSKLA